MCCHRLTLDKAHGECMSLLYKYILLLGTSFLWRNKLLCLTMCEYSINVRVTHMNIWNGSGNLTGVLNHVIEESVLQIVNVSLCQYYI